MSALRVVYDTMVFLQAAINPARRYTTIQAIEDRRVELCISPELTAEIRDVLIRPTLAAKFPALTNVRVAQFLDSINGWATQIPIVPKKFHWAQHPDDDHIFNLAIESQAIHLVTWETRILRLGTDITFDANLLRQLAPRLSIITPQTLANALQT